jgi:hypothetical protein
MLFGLPEKVRPVMYVVRDFAAERVARADAVLAEVRAAIRAGVEPTDVGELKARVEQALKELRAEPANPLRG